MKYTPLQLSRRNFIHYSAVAAAGYMAGCAANPVTGRSQLMLVSENQEISIDRKNSPIQFSADYGISQDAGLNNYLQQTGAKIASKTHRPEMPYSFYCVNAVYVNAYAFPGGSIAATRGILLSLENEAELAALLGHELGHINARHTAQQMSKGTLIQALAGGVSMYAGSQNRVFGEIASQLGSFGTGALLASYSRNNEREADALALEYMVKSRYNPDAVISLMEMLNRTSKHTPNVLELMFATHPMSSERLANAKENIQKRYSRFKNNPIFRERYMDNTAGLRRIKEAIEEMQKGEKEINKKNYKAAESHLKTAMKKAPGDYTALTMMAKVMMLQGKNSQSQTYSQRAKEVYPQEAQGHHLSGLANLRNKNHEASFQDFTAYEKVLPGNPNTTFYQGLSLERMNRHQEAARYYAGYLRIIKQGDQAQYAYKRLVGWGYVKK